MMGESLWIETDGDPLDARPEGAKSEPKRRAPKDGHIGCPLSWFRLVFPVVRGKSELAVALWLYRLRSIRHSRTITVSNGALAELGVDRFAKYRGLRRLAKAGLITIKSNNGKSLCVRFCK
jgi:hypothetical protein